MENLTVVHIRCYHLSYDFFLEGWHGVIYMILTIGYASLSLPTMILNLASLYAFSEKQQKHPSNLLILNTSIADFFTGLLALPLGFLNLLLVFVKKKVYCLLYASTLFVAFTCCVLSFLMVFYVSIDRYMAIFHPFVYSRRNWRRIYMIINLLSWVFSLVLVSTSFLFPLFKPAMFFLASQSVVVAFNCYMSVKVWRVVKQARRVDLNQLVVRRVSGEPSPYIVRSRKLFNTNNEQKKELEKRSSVSFPNSRQESTKSPRSIIQNRRRKDATSKQSNDRKINDYLSQLDIRHRRYRIKQEEQKTSRLTIFMLISVCACYLPYFIVIIWWILDNNYSHLSHTIGSIAVFLLPVKAFLNPLLYFYSMPSIRKKIKDLVTLKKKGKIHSLSINTEFTDVSMTLNE
jgi:7 transmembrane receptor (rhodopsin family).